MKHNNQELETRKLGGKKPKGKSYHTKHRRMKMITSHHQNISWSAIFAEMVKGEEKDRFIWKEKGRI